ncbi:MAG: class I SAM-dependent methyltransferase [Methanosarcina sp.]
MYEWDPELYSSNSSPQKNWGHELLAKLKLKGNEHVLDVGCGDGKLSAEIATCLSKGSVLGVDLSEGMLAFAKSHYPPEKFPSLSFMQVDATDLPFDSEFDIVFSNAALHWIKSPETALKNFWRSLRPGGELLAQMGGKGNASEILRVTDLMLEDKKWSPYFEGFTFPFSFYGPEIYRKWLENTGFSIVRLEVYPKDMAFENKEGLFGWIASVWHPYTQRVPENLRQEFIKDLAEKFYGIYLPDKNGNVHVTMIRLEIEAYAEK